MLSTSQLAHGFKLAIHESLYNYRISTAIELWYNFITLCPAQQALQHNLASQCPELNIAKLTRTLCAN